MKADVITDVTPFKLAKMQDKGDRFSTDGNKPYLL